MKMKVGMSARAKPLINWVTARAVVQMSLRSEARTAKGLEFRA